MNQRGVTLIELIVVVTVIGILAVALGFSYQGWQGAYKVEKATKDIYTDLMDARGRAMSRGLAYFADFNTPAPPAGQGRYRIIEDTNGNLANNAGAADQVLVTFPKTIEYVLNWNGGGIIAFDRRGTITADPNLTDANPEVTIRLISTVNPDYDCIIVSRTRINLGQWGGGICNAR